MLNFALRGFGTHKKGNACCCGIAAWNARTTDAWEPHPLFGKMTPKEWGKLSQIHVDYHLRQFAA
jgi:hypothetical protein